MTEEQQQIVDYVEGTGGEEVEQADEVYDAATARRIIAKLDKALRANTAARQKYAGEPVKFFESEQALDESVRAISLLSQLDEYSELAKAAKLLVSLFEHENADIVDDAVGVLADLVDEDVEAEETSVQEFVNGLMQEGLVAAVGGYLRLLEEQKSTDSEAAQRVLSLVESLGSYDGTAASFGKSSSVMRWLVRRLEGDMNATKQQSAELLTTLLLSIENPSDRGILTFDDIDTLLVQVSKALSKDASEEVRSVAADILDGLRLAVENQSLCSDFLKAEGVELMTRLLHKKKDLAERAIGVLEISVRGTLGGSVATRIVEEGGLKPLFHEFNTNKPSLMMSLIGVVAGMLRWLDLESPARYRVIRKFEEKDFDKIAKFMKFRRALYLRVEKAREHIAEQQRQLEARGDLSREERLVQETDWDATLAEAGIEALRNADSIIAWLFAEDSTNKGVGGLMDALKQPMSSVCDTLTGMFSLGELAPSNRSNCFAVELRVVAKRCRQAD